MPMKRRAKTSAALKSASERSMVRLKRPLPPEIPVRALAPSVLTLLALCSGVTSIRLAYNERWEFAVVAIIMAGLFDSLDGRVARLLKGTSRFGAELDSLSDMICFGVTPALVVYFWTLNTLGGFGWAVVLLYCVCCALRLARFNIAAEQEDESRAPRFFRGVPAPGAAGLLIVPMMLTFATDSELSRNPAFCAVYMAVLAFAMVSRVPTFSFKHVHIDRAYVMPILLGVGLAVGLLTSFFWATVVACAMIYLAILPFGFKAYRKEQQEEAAKGAEEETA